VSEGRRLHDAKIAVDDASSQADWGTFGGWWRRSENAASALKRVYLEIDGAL
jgi:hypothetical protein